VPAHSLNEAVFRRFNNFWTSPNARRVIDAFIVVRSVVNTLRTPAFLR